MTHFFAELFGTMLLILLGNGVVANVVLKKSKAEGAGWIVIAFGWGLAVMLAVYLAGKHSGAHLNPAVTLALAAIGEFSWSDVPLYIAGQLIGAMLGATLVFIHFLPHFKATGDSQAKRDVFCTSPAIRNVFSNLMSEFIGAFVLVAGILAIGANEFADGLNPLIVGFLVLGIGISLGGTTGYAINPARDLGPRIMHAFLPVPGRGSSDWAYVWIPIIGPVGGGIYGAVFYRQFFGDSSQTSIIFWILTLLFLILFAAVMRYSQR
jgi:glycerol uptake facilitator protein